ncbi:MAG: hypothetical protein U5N55_04060 [Cypionkella sp.]|nr:hypothetical protein [Cypionkella sp.]
MRGVSTICLNARRWRLNGSLELPSQQIIDDLDDWRDAVSALENPVHTAYYRFLLFTGLRFDEARSLRWDQVHDDHLHLPMTKNGRAFLTCPCSICTMRY